MLTFLSTVGGKTPTVARRVRGPCRPSTCGCQIYTAEGSRPGTQPYCCGVERSGGDRCSTTRHPRHIRTQHETFLGCCRLEESVARRIGGGWDGTAGDK